MSLDAGATPQILQQGAVSYTSGGVDLTEAQELKSLSSAYSIELVFATDMPSRLTMTDSLPKKRNLAGIKVQIKDKKGTLVLDTESRGPYLLAKLPPGKYSITADCDGTVIRRSVTLRGGKTQRFGFIWHNQPVDLE